MTTMREFLDANPDSSFFKVDGPFGVKGSTVAFRDPRSGKIRTKTDSKHNKTFTAAVRWSARAAGVLMIPKGRGVSLSVVFTFIRPKGCRRSEPCVRPDCDKLARALLDALTGIAYHDDGQVVSLSVRKMYGATMTASVIVMSLEAS